MTIHELYGRLAEELETERANHRQTVEILRQVASGAIAIERVSVNGPRWAIAPAEKAEVA